MRSQTPTSRPARLLYLAALAGLLGGCFTTATAAKQRPAPSLSNAPAVVSRTMETRIQRVPSLLWRDQL